MTITDTGAAQPAAAPWTDPAGAKARWKISVFALIRSEPGGWLLVQQRDTGRWNLPGGRVQPGESIRTALRREVAEELALRPLPRLRLAAVVEQPLARRLFLYFRSTVNPLALQCLDYSGHREIMAAANFARERMPLARCPALKYWLEAADRSPTSGLCWLEIPSPARSGRAREASCQAGRSGLAAPPRAPSLACPPRREPAR